MNVEDSVPTAPIPTPIAPRGTPVKSGVQHAWSQMPEAHHLDVFFNGERLNDCFCADVENGYVVRGRRPFLPGKDSMNLDMGKNGVHMWIERGEVRIVNRSELS